MVHLSLVLSMGLVLVLLAGSCSTAPDLVGDEAVDANTTTSIPVKDAPDTQPAVPQRKITVAGDSISVGFGAELREVVSDSTIVKVIGVEGSGLAFPSSFDWPSRIEELARDFPPDVLIFSLGTNDHQNLYDDQGSLVVERSDPAWVEEYSSRLAKVFDSFEDSETEIWWVGHACVADADLCLTNRTIHRLADELAEDRPWVVVGDFGDLLGSGEKPATVCLNTDGIHLLAECLREASVALLDQNGPEYLESKG